MTARHSPASTAEARLYAILAEVLSFPTDELAELASSGFLSSTVDVLAAELPWAPTLPLAHQVAELPTPGELEAEYICLFDVPDRVPTPLYTGVYAPRRRDAMEELLRTYRHFGVTVSEDAHDLPDFVPTVLEFLGFLVDGAQVAETSALASWERATADILERHLYPWATQTTARLEKKQATPFYRHVIGSIATVTTARLADLRQTYPASLGTAPRR